MGDRGEREGLRCAHCGASTPKRECPVCGEGDGPHLVAVPPRDGSGTPPREVQLVREIKGPTVMDLMSAPDAVLEQLPAQIRAMAEAISEGELAEADLRMDQALGSLHQGPGYRSRRGARIWMVLVLWLLGLCALLAFWA